MSDAIRELRQRLHTLLSADEELASLLATAGLFDRPPGAAMPFLLYGPWRSDDYSTATEQGEEHWLTFEIWTDPNGQRLSLDIAARLRSLIHDQPQPIPPFRLVSLLYRTTRTRRDAKARAVVAEVSFRAVTEG